MLSLRKVNRLGPGRLDVATTATLTSISQTQYDPKLMLELFVTCLALLAYVYIGYPLLLGVATRLCGRTNQRTDALPSVTIVVAAHQESAVIRDKLENFDTIDYPDELLTMLIVSDGSTDGTDEIINAHSNGRIRLTCARNPVRAKLQRSIWRSRKSLAR